MKSLENRNLPADLELLPELYKQFNLLSIVYLQKHYPECEWAPPESEVSYNDQNYICYLKLFAEGAVGTESIVITIDYEDYGGFFICGNTITEALEKVNLKLKEFID
jgi:hypothetical protein